MPLSDTDTDLLFELEADAREGYVSLLTAIDRATHGAPGAGAELVAAVRRLRDWWAEAQLLLADPDDAQTLYPLAPSVVRWVDTLLALAIYSGTPVAEVEAAGRMIHRLSVVVRRPPLPAAA